MISFSGVKLSQLKIDDTGERISVKVGVPFDVAASLKKQRYPLEGHYGNVSWGEMETELAMEALLQELSNPPEQNESEPKRAELRQQPSVIPATVGTGIRCCCRIND